MLRPVHILEPIALDASTLTMAAEAASGPLTIVVGTDAMEHLCVAFACLDAEDRRGAALLELEQLAGRYVEAVGADRRIVLSDEEVEAVATIREGAVALH